MMTTETKTGKDADENVTTKPLKSPLGYLGGKSRIAAQIVEKIPPHHTYVEPFCGGAWVYFTKRPSQVEILNDADGELVNFWRIVKTHLPEFLRHLDFTLVSREEFKREQEMNPRLMTDVQRAVRYYRLQRMGFGGRTHKRTFGTSSVRPNSMNLETVEAKLSESYTRMKRTTIENLDACECIRKYDGPKSFLYLDPPYYNADFYAVSFKGEDFIRLRDTLLDVQGKFILSLNDTPEIREIFKEFIIEEIETKYSISNGKASTGSRSKDRKEVLIHNLEESPSE